MFYTPVFAASQHIYAPDVRQANPAIVVAIHGMCLRPSPRRLRPSPKRRLRGKHYIVAVHPSPPAADDFLRTPATVGIRSVDKVAASLVPRHTRLTCSQVRPTVVYSMSIPVQVAVWLWRLLFDGDACVSLSASPAKGDGKPLVWLIFRHTDWQ